MDRRARGCMTMAVVHLFHLWDKSPRLIKETAVGYTACGQKVPREKMSRFVDDASCPACLARAAQKENAPTVAADRGAVSKPLPQSLIKNQERDDDS
jgi:hypothetical protein